MTIPKTKLLNFFGHCCALLITSLTLFTFFWALRFYFMYESISRNVRFKPARFSDGCCQFKSPFLMSVNQMHVVSSVLQGSVPEGLSLCHLLWWPVPQVLSLGSVQILQLQEAVYSKCLLDLSELLDETQMWSREGREGAEGGKCAVYLLCDCAPPCSLPCPSAVELQSRAFPAVKDNFSPWQQDQWPERFVMAL